MKTASRMQFDEITHTKHKDLKLTADPTVQLPHQRIYEEDLSKIPHKPIPKDHPARIREARKLRDEQGDVLMQPFLDLEERVHHRNRWHTKGYRAPTAHHAHAISKRSQGRGQGRTLLSTEGSTAEWNSASEDLFAKMAAGAENRVQFKVTPSGANPSIGSITFIKPAGWGTINDINLKDLVHTAGDETSTRTTLRSAVGFRKDDDSTSDVDETFGFMVLKQGSTVSVAVLVANAQLTDLPGFTTADIPSLSGLPALQGPVAVSYTSAEGRPSHLVDVYQDIAMPTDMDRFTYQKLQEALLIAAPGASLPTVAFADSGTFSGDFTGIGKLNNGPRHPTRSIFKRFTFPTGNPPKYEDNVSPTRHRFRLSEDGKWNATDNKEFEDSASFVQTGAAMQVMYMYYNYVGYYEHNM